MSTSYDPEVMALLEASPTFILYSPTGVGKTIQAVLAFPDCIFFTHNMDTYRSLAAFMVERPEEAKKIGLLKLPKVIEIPEFRLPEPGEYGYETGQMVSVSAYDEIRAWLAKIVAAKSAGGMTKLRGVIYDEWSFLADRVHKEMLDRSALKRTKLTITQGGSADGFAVNRELVDFHRYVLSVAQATKLVFGFICHATQPSYFDATGQEANKIASAKRGALKYRGGPKLPTGTLMESFAAQCSFVLQLVAEDEVGETQRFILTEPNEFWVRKARHFGLPAKIDLSKMNVRQMLQRAGCVPKDAQ